MIAGISSLMPSRSLGAGAVAAHLKAHKLNHTLRDLRTFNVVLGVEKAY
jgi:hypothetical protein